jgi:hypothetical protein
MSDCNAATQAVEDTLIEHLGDEAHIGMHSNPAAVRRRYTRTLLTTVLQCVYAEESEAGYIRPLSVDTEDSARLPQTHSYR